MRVGIAGYGLAGRYFHAPLLKGCGYEVVAIATGNAERSIHAKTDFPDVHVVPTIEDLVAHELDLVVVASANIVHAQHAIAAINAGIAVVIDKPMGRTYAETQEIISAGDRARVPVSTFFNRRWDKCRYRLGVYYKCSNYSRNYTNCLCSVLGSWIVYGW